jgi:hypothetical protein
MYSRLFDCMYLNRPWSFIYRDLNLIGVEIYTNLVLK